MAQDGGQERHAQLRGHAQPWEAHRNVQEELPTVDEVLERGSSEGFL